MLLNLGFRNFPGDMLLYFDYANHVKDGHVPYRDFALEYPPLALAPILAPFYISRSSAASSWASSACSRWRCTSWRWRAAGSSGV